MSIKQTGSPILVVLTLVTLAATPAAWSGKLYKWVDGNGNVTYQDQPPPEGAEVLGEYSDSAPIKTSLATAVANAPITLYAVPKCDACDLVRLFLQKKGIPFSEVDVAQDRDAQQALIDKSGQLGVPTLLIGYVALSGYNVSSIEAELRKSGYIPRESAEESGEQPSDEVAGEQDSPVQDQDQVTAQSGNDQPATASNY